MKPILCRKCFEEYSQALYICGKSGCSLEGEPQPVQSVEGHPGQMLCSNCQSTLVSRICPGCGYSMETDDDNLTLPFSIIGAGGSGKSSFLAAMINRIKTDLCKVYGCALHPLGGDASMAMYEREYHYPLFVQGHCAAPTMQEDLEPLPFSLVFSGQPPAGKTCNITFYDACGGNFESEKVLASCNRSIYHSKGILLLLEPSQLPSVRETLKMQGKPILESDPAVLVARIIHLIRSGLGIKNMQQQLDIPIAVCLTKLDAVRGLLDPSSFVGSTSRHLREAYMDKIDLDSCDLEVQSLIESWAGKELVNQIQGQFKDSAFFALSALGSQPGELGQVHRVSPHRILDPLLWLLWRNDIISCR